MDGYSLCYCIGTGLACTQIWGSPCVHLSHHHSHPATQSKHTNNQINGRIPTWSFSALRSWHISNNYSPVYSSSVRIKEISQLAPLLSHWGCTICKIPAITSPLPCSHENCLQLDHLVVTEGLDQSIRLLESETSSTIGTYIMVDKAHITTSVSLECIGVWVCVHACTHMCVWYVAHNSYNLAVIYVHNCRAYCSRWPTGPDTPIWDSIV
jgi:hypothetical protein